MSRKRTEEPEKENGERWLLTYSDLITLLMIFFVVLYSISKVDANKFKALADSLNKALGGGQPAKIAIANSPQGPSFLNTGYPQNNTTVPSKTNNKDNAANTQNSSSSPLNQGANTNQGQGNVDQENMTIEGIKARLDKFAADNGIQTQLISTIEERGLVISIHDTLLFDSGSDVITPKAREILDKVSAVLAPTPNFIRVEGHTDNLPIHTSEFPSNWELSVLRATNVVEILASSGISPDRLSATGYGEYRPVASNATEAGRAQNRRVDLTVLRSKYDFVEPGTAAPTPGSTGTSSTGTGSTSTGSAGTK